MTYLVFGKSGQLARELAPLLGEDGVFLDRAAADLSDPEASAAIVSECTAQAVIIAAAYTAVDRAEEDEALATAINGAAPGAIAVACAAKGLPLVYVSTDYVFDGAGDVPFAPDAPTAPINAYGRSKLAGEAAIRASGVRHVILRTSWVVSAHGSNFVKTMLRLGAARDSLTVVDDQIGGPTPARDLARACRAAADGLIHGAPGGTYHFAGAPDTSWAGFARAIMTAANLSCEITPIPSANYPTPAPRPKNSRLDCTSFTEAFGIPRPDWRAALPQIISDIGEST